MLEFQVLQSIDISPEDSHVALAQFTPEARYEFGLADTANRPEAEMRLQVWEFETCFQLLLFLKFSMHFHFFLYYCLDRMHSYYLLY